MMFVPDIMVDLIFLNLLSSIVQGSPWPKELSIVPLLTATTTTSAPSKYECKEECKYSWEISQTLDDCKGKRLSCIPAWTEPFDTKKLNYKSNQLKHLPADVFRSQFRDRTALSWVKELDLSFNQLNQIDTNAFRGLNSLETLSLVSNNLKELSKGMFNGLGELKWLNLRINPIEVVPTDAFQPLKKLENLEFSFCHIKIISPNSFRGLRSLLILDLSNNRLDSNSIMQDSFAGLPKLSTVKLDHNTDTLRLKDVNWMEAFGINTEHRTSIQKRSDYEDEEDYGDLLEFNTTPFVQQKKEPEFYEVPCKCKRLRSDPSNTVTCPLIWKFFKANMTLECIGTARQAEYKVRSGQEDVFAETDTALVNVTGHWLLKHVKEIWALILVILNVVMIIAYEVFLN